jgi:Ala-tRNA(Pro) deacylase
LHCRILNAGLLLQLETPEQQEFAALFLDCDVGAMPPFGNLYSLEVYVDEELSRQPQITFQAGSHHELATMSYADYAKLVKPTVCEFCSHARLAT